MIIHLIKKLANSNVKYFFLRNINILYTLFIHHHYCMRLDIYISQTYALSRNRAQFIIQEWLVLVNEKTVKKTAFSIDETDSITLLEDKKTEWVSRSAVKLSDYIEQFPMQIDGLICLDIGSSTGWFTQVLLTHGAKEVTALDVWSLQLHESLRKNCRIHLFENTDIRDFSSEKDFSIITTDVSFISLTQIIPSISRLANSSTQIILLYKPQFEVGKIHLKKTGVPKNEIIIQKKMQEFQEFLKNSWFIILRVLPSSLKWETGNQEYIIHCKKTDWVAI